MPYPKIYAATELAAQLQPPTPLDGTLKDAQRFVDRITRSTWWSKHCKPLFNHEVPTKVILQEDDSPDMGGALIVDPEVQYFHRGKQVPLIYVGPNPSYGDVPAIADPWVLLHELAHVWEFNSWHDKYFIYAYLKLVCKYLGIEHHAALVEELRTAKVRLNYGLV